MADKVSTSISIIDIKERNIGINEPTEKFKKSFDPKELHVGINLNLSADEKKESLTLNLALKYVYGDEQSDDAVELLKASFSFVFGLTNFNKIVKIEEDVIDLPDDISTMLLSISISTSRGLIAAKSRGYFINKYYLPILSPKNILQDHTKEN